MNLLAADTQTAITSCITSFMVLLRIDGTDDDGIYQTFSKIVAAQESLNEKKETGVDRSHFLNVMEHAFRDTLKKKVKWNGVHLIDVSLLNQVAMPLVVCITCCWYGDAFTKMHTYAM